jgi:hypothetical protein
MRNVIISSRRNSAIAKLQRRKRFLTPCAVPGMWVSSTVYPLDVDASSEHEGKP